MATNILRKNLLLVGIFLLSSIIAKATETSNILTKAIPAQERVELVRNQIKQNPELTMFDKIATHLWNFYRRDKSFILRNTKNRTDAQNISKNIDYLDNFINKKYLDQNLSFADYSFIAFMWKEILTEKPKFQQGSLPKHFDNFENTLQAINQGQTAHDDFRFLTSQGFVLPHISKTALVPIKSINENWGFVVEDRFTYTDFLGVGTNKELNYDGILGPCVGMWAHDEIHMKRCLRCQIPSLPKLDLLGPAKTGMLIRKKALKALRETDAHKIIELVFYDVFHENFQLRSHFAEGKLVDYIEETIERYQARLENSQETTNFKHVPEIERKLLYKNRIKYFNLRLPDLNHLKIDISGTTDEDRAEDFAKKMIQGLQDLLQAAQQHCSKRFASGVLGDNESQALAY